MPGKTKKSKKAQHPKLPTLQDLVAVASRFSPGSEALFTETSRLLGIPNFNTSSGLKQCSELFGVISSNLEQIFAQSRRYRADTVSADKIAATIIVIYGRIGIDKLLLKRIVAQTDFFQNAISLLHSDIARSVVMPVLCSLGHTLDIDVLEGLARYSSTILDCVEGHLDDIKYAESGACVLTHSIGLVLADAHPNPELAKVVSLPRIIRFLLRVVRVPDATPISVGHFLDLCSSTARYHPAIFHAIPDCVDFLVACTRAQDLGFRNAALLSLYGICSAATASEYRPPQPVPFQYNMAADMKRIRDFEKLTSLFDNLLENSHRSLADFGLRLVDLILANEVGVRGVWMDPDTFFLDTESCSRLLTNLGCTQFIDVLRLSAEAVRNSGSGSQASMKGDILQAEFLLASRKDTEACAFAQRCIQRHPSVAFFYYVLATNETVDIFTSVRFAEKALLCPDSTDFLRKKLLFSFVNSSVTMITLLLKTGTFTASPVQQVILLAQKARSHAISYIEDVPPHSDNMPEIIALAIHLTFLLEGHTLSDDCRELQTNRHRLSQAYAIARSPIREFEPSQPCLVVDKIFARMPIAWRVWKPFISRHPGKHLYPVIDPDFDLAAWLEKLETSDPQSRSFHISGVNPNTDRYGPARLHHCSACNAASATLKQCSRCQKTRYCNSDCQRNHWKIHRETCNKQ
ncbi:hypothetical protein B0H19DRAFT_1369312 [Mycena capillaripes]|nr:hypothetical protein B0H19DRAFT_1369312 [Mycena capillaripes]